MMRKLLVLARLPLLWLPTAVIERLLKGRLRVVDGRRIDPKAQLLGEMVETIRAGAAPNVEDSRAQMARMAGVLDQPCPADVTKLDIQLAGGQGPRPARIYTPPGGNSEAMPTLLFLHGGGWIQCDLDTHDGLCGKLAKWAGIRVISYDYRLAPEHKFPAGLEDVIAAYHAIQTQADRLGVDLGHLVVGGDSAGANLTAALMHVLTETGGPLPRAQVLIYPALDGRMTSASLKSLQDAFLLNQDRMQWYLDLYLADGQDRLDPRVSPMQSNHLAGQPPALVIVGGHDPLRDDGITYAERLNAVGTKADLIEYPGEIHAFMSMARIMPQANTAIRATADWVRAALE